MEPVKALVIPLPSGFFFPVFSLTSLAEKTYKGATFEAADRTTVTRLGLSGFVDDTNTVVNSNHPQSESTIIELLAHLQHDAQLWCNLLHISGGKLELGKCSYHALRFKFKPDGTPVPITDGDLPPLQLIDPQTEQRHDIPFLSARHAHKILGHWKAPADPRQTEQIQAIINKANQQALLISTSPLTRHGAFLAYNGIYVASLRYVLPQCWFSVRKLGKSEQTSLSKIIAKCGLARTTPHAILFAPKDMAGGGFLHWHTIQGEGQVKQFLKHWRTVTKESAMLRINVSWTQWQAGTGESILYDVHTELPHVESRWLPSLRAFLATINGHIELDNSYIPALERAGDMHIMDLVISSKEFTPEDIKLVNYCRMYLHVATISELFDSQGTRLLPHMLECRRPSWFDPSMPTVNQRRPSKYQQRYQWQRLCRMMCTTSHHAGQWIRLTQWTQPTSQLRLRREAYQSTNDEKVVYVWHDTAYWLAKPHAFLAQQYQMVHTTEWTPCDECIPIDIDQFFTPRRFSIRPPNCFRESTGDNPTHAHSFAEYIQSMREWEQQLMSHITWLQQPFEMMHYLHHSRKASDKLFIVSDGSSIDQQTMSFGLVIGLSNGTKFIEAMGPAHGIPSSHRAECTGCLAGSIIVKYLQEYTNTTLPTDMETLILSDNMAMITHLQDRMRYTNVYANSTLRADWDLLEETHTTFGATLSPLYKFQWVKGHQDNREGQQLAIDAQYNIIADQLATQYTSEVSAKYLATTPIMTNTGCILYIDGKAQHGKYSLGVRRASAHPAYLKYMSCRHKWNNDTLLAIDWEAFQKAARQFKPNSANLLKLVYDKLPTNQQRAKYNSTASPLCHFCTEIETFDHLCTSTCNQRSKDFRERLSHNIDHYFEKRNAPKQFQQMFFDALTRWLNPNTTGHQLHGPWA